MLLCAIFSLTLFAARDIVQFVPFNKHAHSLADLQRETLMEIPHQVTQYFQNKGISPGEHQHIDLAHRPMATATAVPMATATATSMATAVAVNAYAAQGKALLHASLK